MNINVLRSYSNMLEYFLNSGNISYDKNEEDVIELLVNPIKEFCLLIRNITERCSASERELERIAVCLNALWYAFNQRCDIRESVRNSNFNIPRNISNSVFEFCKIPFNSRVNFSLIAQMASILELDIRKATAIVF